MTPNEFDSYIREAMARNRAWFESIEPPARDNDVLNIESKLGRALPEQFKHFAKKFGGGYFGGINVSTLDEKSEWYVLSRPIVDVDNKAMLVISDDESGGYYGFVLEGDTFQSSVTYINPDDGNNRENAAPSFFEFIDRFAIKI